jgi:hypothetical protein
VFTGTIVSRVKWIKTNLGFKKTFIRLAGIFSCCLIFSVPVPALNGPSYVATCTNCATTSDFTAAAISQAEALVRPGTYVMVSTSTAETAYMLITGTVRLSGSGFGGNSHPILTNIAATPISSTGASLAGEPESTLESYYAALDQTFMGTERSNPNVWIAGWLPPFEISTDSEIADALYSHAASILDGLDDGDTITLTWTDGSGIVAQFTVNKLAGVFVGITFKSATRNGKPCDRQGNSITNPNTSGDGGGIATVPGFGPGSSWTWQIAGGSQCYASGSVTNPDGSTFVYGGWSPC